MLAIPKPVACIPISHVSTIRWIEPLVICQRPLTAECSPARLRHSADCEVTVPLHFNWPRIRSIHSIVSPYNNQLQPPFLRRLES
jgi:hypothetical protein